MRIALIGFYLTLRHGLAPAMLEAFARGPSGPGDAVEIETFGFTNRTDDIVILRRLVQYRPQVVGFSCYIWNYRKVLRLCPHIKQAIPGVRIVLGGPQVGHRPEDLLAGCPHVDTLVLGEGEVTFSELLQSYLDDRQDLSHIPGLVFRRDGEVIRTPPREPVADLDSLPSPFLAGVIDLDNVDGVIGAFETYRGCPMGCRFCSWGKKRQVRYFNMERLERELKMILDARIHRVWLADAYGNLHPERFKHILRFIAEHNSGCTSFDFELSGEKLDAETLDLLGRLPGGYLEFGVQSTNPAAQEKMGRRLRWDALKNNVLDVRRRAPNYDVFVDLIYGLPGDDGAGHERSMRDALQLRPDRLQNHRLRLLAGSEFLVNAPHYGLEYEEGTFFATRSDTFLPEQMETAAEWSFRFQLFENPAVNRTVYLLSNISGLAPFDLFVGLFERITEWTDPRVLLEGPDYSPEQHAALSAVLDQYIDDVLDPRPPQEEQGHRSFSAEQINGAAQRLKELARYLNLIDVLQKTHTVQLRYGTAGDRPPAEVDVSSGNAVSGQSVFRLRDGVRLEAFGFDMATANSGSWISPEADIRELGERPHQLVIDLPGARVQEITADEAALLERLDGTKRLEQLADGGSETRLTAAAAALFQGGWIEPVQGAGEADGLTNMA